MRKKAFSIIEVLFIIAILGVIVMVALPKFNDSLKKSHVTNIKNDITTIREALIQYKNENILRNDDSIYESLEDSNDLLFNRILTYPIISSKEHKANAWSKISNNTYKVWIDNYNSVDFTYDNAENTFTCDEDDLICKELSQ